MIGTVDLADATQGWAPEPVTTTGGTSAWTVAAVSGMFDLDPVAGEGDPLPPMWHWFGFLEHPRSDELGDDGHPLHGHFLPPIPDRRRMIAGGRLRIGEPMRVGQTYTRRSSLASSQVKHGRSGDMLLVTVRSEFFEGDDLLATEESDVVYRSQPPGQARGIPAGDAEDGQAPPPSDEAVELTPDERLLFRFSALTYNTHRIHYDQPYVTGVEGYPGLVVHGPLLALMCLEVPRRHGQPVRSVDYRLSRPAFAGTRIVADRTDDHGGVAAGVPGRPPSITATLG
ncbi:hypothetical protein [Actinomycetospora termitidis]|uniref:N-terminal of MaoC-like dehydratase domain-containing protein n=1 Tax=Actinomycetospora termitidis TaxID=3053470 RepID=A0ABT7M5M9_9PSEU|nr:hypothetical protein [Actinomycetospora sp. Odt1-22]MDL5155945.1 hypothetical protein [Actinomycetospora sp. Odt1-22]